MTDKLLTSGEAARRLSVSVSTLARWRQEGRLPYIRVHPAAHPRYRESDIDALMAERQDTQ